MVRKKIHRKNNIAYTDKFGIAPYNNFNVRIVIVEKTDEATVEAVNKMFPAMEFAANHLAMVHRHYDGAKELVILFNVNQNYGAEVTADCIAHECTHVKNQVFESIGSPIITDFGGADEPEAYLMGHLTHIIFDFFIRTGHFDKINFNYNERHY